MERKSHQFIIKLNFNIKDKVSIGSNIKNFTILNMNLNYLKKQLWDKKDNINVITKSSAKLKNLAKKDTFPNE